MLQVESLSKFRGSLAAGSTLVVLALLAGPAGAQSQQDRDGLARLIDGGGRMQIGAPRPEPESSKEAGTLERLTGVWINGPGFDVTYGMTYERCAARCLANAQCKMIEFYKPEQKCNLYSALRPRLKGGSSIVGIRG